MKMYAGTSGIETMISVQLPGIVAALALALWTIPVDQADHIVEWATSETWFVRFVEWTSSAQWLAAFLALAVFTLCGQIVASFSGMLEVLILDNTTMYKLKLDRKQYLGQWYDYLKDLPQNNNPYIARIVLSFQFETRMALAMFLLSASTWHLSWWYGFIALIAGVVSYLRGGVHHYELGQYRKQTYA